VNPVWPKLRGESSEPAGPPGTNVSKSSARELPATTPARAVAARASEAGLLLLNCGVHHQVIRWIPPLDVTVPEIEEALAIFEQALQG